jgi:hypothetical protein
MKRRTNIALALTFAVAIAAGWPFLRTFGRTERFLAQATEILNDGAAHPGIVEIKLSGAESFTALLEHSCCTGAGFNAVALRTSEGTIYHSRNNYCGEEGFHAVIDGIELESLVDLDSYLLANGYTKIGQNMTADSTASRRESP